MPDPQEIGLPPRASGKPAQQEVQTAEDQEMESVTLRRSRRRKKQEKEEESTFGIWYTRFLIVGGVLLVLASIGLIILKLVDDKPVVGKYLEERVMSYIYSEEPELTIIGPQKALGKSESFLLFIEVGNWLSSLIAVAWLNRYNRTIYRTTIQKRKVFLNQKFGCNLWPSRAGMRWPLPS